MKIQNLKIKSFRGIPNELSINLTDKKGQPTSTIIFGDNGSGKSSIVDAIEFNLQGRIDRSHSLNNHLRPSPISFRHNLFNAETIITFQDDSTSKRTITVEFDENKHFHLKSDTKGTNPYFKTTPIVLRRNDIVSYASTPVQRKQILFWSFIYYNYDEEDEIDVADKALIQSLENELIEVKKHRDKKIKQLANELKIEQNEIPVPLSEFQKFAKEKVRKGFKTEQIRFFNSTGKLKGINYDAVKLSNEIILILINIRQLNKKRKSSKITDSSKEIRKNQVKKFLSDASQTLSKSFTLISRLNFIEEINIEIGKVSEVSFEILVKLKNGQIAQPIRIFSEANLDLLILLLFTSLIKEAEKYGQGKLLILDDVLQSVDSTVRLNFIEYLLKEFSDWQIVITAHDRLWLNQLRSSFRRNNHSFKEIEIFNWEFDNGPSISEINSNFNEKQAIENAISTGNAQFIASQSGIILETICHKLSMSLNTSIHRKPEDKYTIGDLWPGIKKFFKKTHLYSLTDEIDKNLFIRNLIGAHYNEWAISLSNQELKEFAQSIKQFHECVFCESCQSWLSKNGQCSCGKIKI